ncbi:hypothetical protein KOW79_007033 [Hemibagrus wyckioides]|uniref:Ig-like domain-containing protein n=1 Tax=Hemibagrus wyckioides TaxID=337641 RepID=A0A9D3NV82_9TELE|nr:hypothetical protein KOW79_007033 [Hemibagrus wyckioides]
MYTVQPGRRWVTAQSTTESPVYQPDKELSVTIGHSATLRCCVPENTFGIITWFKQTNREKPQIIVTVYKNGGEVFYTGFQKSRFRIERSSNCFNMTISNIIQSDEAMYYCALTRVNLVFGDGTYFKIKETSKPALSDNSVVCEPTLHGNNTNMNTQENTVSEMISSLHWTVIGLGTALGLCALLIFCLTYFILRRKSENSRFPNVYFDAPLESEAESLNYAALQFSKKKAKAEKRKRGSSDECVYSDVKKTIQSALVDAELLCNSSQSYQVIVLIKSSVCISEIQLLYNVVF